MDDRAARRSVADLDGLDGEQPFLLWLAPMLPHVPLDPPAAFRERYNTVRPHSSLGYRPPAPEAVMGPGNAFGAMLLRPCPAAQKLSL